MWDKVLQHKSHNNDRDSKLDFYDLCRIIYIKVMPDLFELPEEHFPSPLTYHKR